MKNTKIIFVLIAMIMLTNVGMAQNQPTGGNNQPLPAFCRGYPNIPLIYIGFCATYFQQSSSPNPPGGNRPAATDERPSPEIFYQDIKSGAKPVCAGNYRNGFEAVTNCIQYIIDRLKPLAAILLVLTITIAGAYLIFSPASPDKAQLAWKIFFWAVIGFIIVFSADLLRGLIREVSGQR